VPTEVSEKSDEEKKLEEKLKNIQAMEDKINMK
jgi:hypothetical protein